MIDKLLSELPKYLVVADSTSDVFLYFASESSRHTENYYELTILKDKTLYVGRCKEYGLFFHVVPYKNSLLETLQEMKNILANDKRLIKNPNE